MTLFRNFAAAAVASATLLVAPAAMSATILIDSFDDRQEVRSGPDGGFGETNTQSGLSVLGGTRTLSVLTDPKNGAGQPAGGSKLTSTGLSGFPTPSILQFENGDGQTGIATVTYDGGVFTDPNGFDLTGNGLLDKFFFEILTADLTGTIFTTIVTSVGGATSQVVENIDGSFTPFTKFSDFTGTANFTEVTSLSFIFNSNGVDSFDGSIGSISVVPLPASALLLLGGLGGLFGAGAINRRRRREA